MNDSGVRQEPPRRGMNIDSQLIDRLKAGEFASRKSLGVVMIRLMPASSRSCFSSTSCPWGLPIGDHKARQRADLTGPHGCFLMGSMLQDCPGPPEQGQMQTKERIRHLGKTITDRCGHTNTNGSLDSQSPCGSRSPILSRYDSLGTFDRPQPTIPSHKKHRRRPLTEAELQSVQNSWKAVSGVARLARGLHALGLSLSYSVNTDTGEVTVDDFGPLNQRARNLLYRHKIQAMWLKRLQRARSEEARMVAREHLYDDL